MEEEEEEEERECDPERMRNSVFLAFSLFSDEISFKDWKNKDRIVQLLF